MYYASTVLRRILYVRPDPSFKTYWVRVSMLGRERESGVTATVFVVNVQDCHIYFFFFSALKPSSKIFVGKCAESTSLEDRQSHFLCTPPHLPS